MPVSVFISHVYEDRGSRDLVKAWAAGGHLGPGVVATGESADVRQGGDSAIRAHIGPKVRGASAVLVLLGNDTHNHPWIEYEAQFAQSHHVKVLLVRIPGTRGAAPPSLRWASEVALDARAIRSALGM